jgi:hypothetical protein
MTGVGICWWCREAFPIEELLHLEGASISGSPPLRLPASWSEEERRSTLICRMRDGQASGCVVAFVNLRHSHDVELAEAAVGKGRSLVEVLAYLVSQGDEEEELGRIERLHGGTIAEVVREYLRSERKDAWNLYPPDGGHPDR